MTACHEPANGGKPKCIRDSDFERINERLDHQDARIGGTFREASAAREAAERAESQAAGARVAAERAANEVNALAGEIRDDRQQRIRECDIRHEGINARLELIPRAPLKSIDYEELSDTGVIRASRLLEEENRQLRAQLLAANTQAASATARFDERTRNSERVHNKSIARWKLVTGLIVTVLTSGVATAFLANLIGGR
jgi:hypothetical protein